MFVSHPRPEKQLSYLTAPVLRTTQLPNGHHLSFPLWLTSGTLRTYQTWFASAPIPVSHRDVLSPICRFSPKLKSYISGPSPICDTVLPRPR